MRTSSALPGTRQCALHRITLKLFDVEAHGPARGKRVGDRRRTSTTRPCVSAVAAAEAEPSGAVVYFPRATTYGADSARAHARYHVARGGRRGGAGSPCGQERLAPSDRGDDCRASLSRISGSIAWVPSGAHGPRARRHPIAALRRCTRGASHRERRARAPARGSGVGFATAECSASSCGTASPENACVIARILRRIGDDCLIERVTGERCAGHGGVLEGCRPLHDSPVARAMSLPRRRSQISQNVEKTGNVMEDVRATLCNAYSGAFRVGCVSEDSRCDRESHGDPDPQHRGGPRDGPGLVVVESAGKVEA